MKNKNVAAILAFFLGGFGIHRFYLGQGGMGMMYLFFNMVTAAWRVPIMMIIGVIDALALVAMSDTEFDLKYNKKYGTRTRSRNTDFDRRGTRTKSRTQRQETRKYSRTSYRSPRKNPHKAEGIKKFKEYDYDDAIIAFQKSLEISPDDIATHFNLACCYSLTEDAQKSLHHLNLAIKNGYKDFDSIQAHDSLAYLRIQPEYEAYVENGYKIVPSIKSNRTKEATSDKKGNLLEELKQLAELRERGVISETEFAEQKRRLLS